MKPGAVHTIDTSSVPAAIVDTPGPEIDYPWIVWSRHVTDGSEVVSWNIESGRLTVLAHTAYSNRVALDSGLAIYDDHVSANRSSLFAVPVDGSGIPEAIAVGHQAVFPQAANGTMAWLDLNDAGRPTELWAARLLAPRPLRLMGGLDGQVPSCGSKFVVEEKDGDIVAIPLDGGPPVTVWQSESALKMTPDSADLSVPARWRARGMSVTWATMVHTGQPDEQTTIHVADLNG